MDGAIPIATMFPPIALLLFAAVVPLVQPLQALHHQAQHHQALHHQHQHHQAPVPQAALIATRPTIATIRVGQLLAARQTMQPLALPHRPAPCGAPPLQVQRQVQRPRVLHLLEGIWDSTLRMA